MVMTVQILLREFNDEFDTAQTIYVLQKLKVY